MMPRNIHDNQQTRTHPTASILPCRSQILTAAARFISLMMMMIRRRMAAMLRIQIFFCDVYDNHDEDDGYVDDDDQCL